ncbi:flagellar hook-basal body complex protein FliE [Caenimonas koreensis]|uniref:Flagellar hook-basal body complex protein FliE n=1 Tax=Caenimonas koreensis DSM 17982 TaxID=1121255 RepID=A0A844BB58_9BURK|nr:flagellar hook-basal body complex protein FliE [Caenimonas koreensis]MRD48687.1 flagellar hook-basal body complex protein FliE [Caenimonas koreensis DSM 17982]
MTVPVEAIAAMPVNAVLPNDMVAPVAPSAVHTTGSATGVPFGELITKGLGEVNQKLLASQADMQRLAAGDTQNLHQMMIRLEESRISLQLMMQVRNRLLEAYQDVMKMQV